MATSGLCSAVQIPSPVNDKVPVGSDPISAPKAMQHSFGPLAVELMCQFEDNAVTRIGIIGICATGCCRTVQVSGGVGDQTCCAITIANLGEVVNHLVLIGRRDICDQAESYRCDHYSRARRC